jgi:hypothetical protein
MTTLRKPTWWQPYVLVPVLGGLFILEHHAALAPGWRMGVQAAIICVISGLAWRWLRANAYALMTWPTLRHPHDYNAHHPGDWAYATQVAGRPVRVRRTRQYVHASAHGNESWPYSRN